LKVLIDINHPAHVHFFRNAAKLLQADGHEVLFTSRAKDVTIALLDALGIPHLTLSRLGKSKLALLRELLQRDFRLWRVTRKFKPDVMLAIGGTFIAHVGKVTGIPSLVFYDTENAHMQNRITYPFARLVVVPDCYKAWLPAHHRRYAGYHELAYLHPRYFTPDAAVAEANGYEPGRDNFLLRIVSWQANHDVGERGWNRDLLAAVVGFLAQRGRVLISSEQPLGAEFAPYLYRGNPAALHDVLAHCRLCLGESATLASEASVLGVPSIYAAHTGRGYTDEQEEKYGLVTNLQQLDAEAIIAAAAAILEQPREHWQAQRQRLLDDCVDVTSLIVQLAREFGQG